MDDDGLGYRNMHYYDPHGKKNLGLHLSPAEEHRTKPFLSNGGFLFRDCGVSPSPIPPAAMHMEFMRDLRNGWIGQRDGSIAGIGHRDGGISGLCHRDAGMMMDHRYDISGIGHRESNIASLLSSNHNYATTISNATDFHTLQMLHPPDPPKDNTVVKVEDPVTEDIPLKKKKRKSESKPCKAPKPKKPKKCPESKRDGADPSVSRRKGEKKSMELMINGFSIDLSGIPPPVCSCTGTPQQCYRWGAGGWQSACCTTSMSVYPLPMSSKRKGARIAGRKMSLGAFKKVLEKFAGDGHQFKDPIDLKHFWAKHGTNKFVTIR